MSFHQKIRGNDRHDPAGGKETGPAHPTGAKAVWILQRFRSRSGALANPNTARLVDALAARGLAAQLVNPDRVDQALGPDALRIGGQTVAQPLALIGRSGSNTGARARALSAALEQRGTVALPSARALALAGDKRVAGQLLSAAGLPVPDFEEIDPGVDAHAIGQRLGWPLVLKAARGSKGRSVQLVRGPGELAMAVAGLLDQGPLIAQRFLSESRGRDIRVMVVGGTAIGAMERTARDTDAFLANIASGGVGRSVPLSSGIARLAEAAARVAELEIAGVDLLHAGAGFAVCELNTAPGFVAFEAVTGIDVAGAIAALDAARLARW